MKLKPGDKCLIITEGHSAYSTHNFKKGSIVEFVEEKYYDYKNEAEYTFKGFVYYWSPPREGHQYLNKEDFIPLTRASKILYGVKE